MMEMLGLLGLILAKANGLRVPFWCWMVLLLWSAAHLAVAWFWTGTEEE